jgi:SAM-dependent methyltransferase
MPRSRRRHGVRIEVISELDASHAGFDVTDERTLRALRDAEDRHFWHLTRNELIVERLAAIGVRPGARFVELGCGGGCVTAYLSRAGYDVVGVDGHRALVELASSRAPDARFWVHDLSRGAGGLPERGFDAAGLFDVIEHLDDPRAALRDALDLVRDGGWLVGTVPASMRLWSRVDVQAGHRRRYEPSTLRADLRSIDVADIRIAPFNRVLVPAMMVQRRVVSRLGDRGRISEANLGVPPWWANRLAAWVLRAERRLSPVLDRRNLPGASLWFAARKRTNRGEGVPRGGVEPPT